MVSGRNIGIALLTALAAVVAVLTTVAVPVLGRGGDQTLERCARYAAQAQARARTVTGNGAAVAVLGDSYSVGLGLRNPTGSWPSRLSGRVMVEGFSGSGFAASSSPCRRSSYAARVGRLAAAPTVVVEGGLNDYDRPDPEIRAGIRRVLAVLAGQRVLVVGPAPAPARADRVGRVDALLAAECRRAGVAYLSMLDQDLAYLADRLHLTAAGQRAFGDAVAERLAKVSSGRG